MKLAPWLLPRDNAVERVLQGQFDKGEPGR
jgi:hypothetical protein